MTRLEDGIINLLSKTDRKSFQWWSRPYIVKVCAAKKTDSMERVLYALHKLVKAGNIEVRTNSNDELQYRFVYQ